MNIDVYKKISFFQGMVESESEKQCKAAYSNSFAPKIGGILDKAFSELTLKEKRRIQGRMQSRRPGVIALEEPREAEEE